MYFCPSCKINLEKVKSAKGDYLKCEKNACKLFNKKFKIHNKKPILIPFGFKDCIFKSDFSDKFINLGSSKRSSKKKLAKLKLVLQKIFYGQSRKTIDNFNIVLNHLKTNNKLLIIGGGSIGSGMDNFLFSCKEKKIIIQSIDVYDSDQITVIADAHYLPFPDEYFDAVIIQAVLEHVLNPARVVNEIRRVLVNRGLVFAETPFMQSVHEGPFDFIRFSHSGHRWLFRKFEEVSSGAHQGGFSSSLFIFSHTLSGVFKNYKVGLILRIFFTRICSFLDNLISSKNNIDVACGLYFIGKKSTSLKKNSWIIDYYKGGQ